MDLKKDAYGQEVWAHLRDKESYEVVERDDGLVGISGSANAYFAEYKDWPKHQQRAIRLAHGRVLDVGVGAGRVSLYLQRRGLTVTAIDNSPLAVTTSKRRGVRDARVLPIAKVDRFAPGTFGTVVMFGNNFGLFGSFRRAKVLLRKLHRVTTPDALIIAESNDPYRTTDPVHLAYHRFNRKRGRMPGQLRIRVRFKNYIGDWFDYLIVSRLEMKKILAGTGWAIKKFIGSGKSMYTAVIKKV